MAVQAQINANSQNARESLGPTAGASEVRARLDTLTRGQPAKAVSIVLPQEDPAELEAMIRAWVEDMKPHGPAERKLVERAAKIAWKLDRAERSETARLALRVKKAQFRPGEYAEHRVCELGRKLLYMTGPRLLKGSCPPWDDNPSAFLKGLEATAEGCRWLLDRWTELGDILRRRVPWTLTDLFKSIRLQGKHPIEAINDPSLNLQIQAWELLSPGAAVDFWGRCYNMTPREDPGFQGFMEWREIVDKPEDEDACYAAIEGVIDEHIVRLEELISLHEEIAADEAIDRADAASFDPGPAAEKLRKHEAAKSRELRQTLELLLKMQAAGRKSARETEVPAERPCPPEASKPRTEETSRRELRTTERSCAPLQRPEASAAPRPKNSKGGSGKAKTGRHPAPFALPEAIEMIVRGCLADELRAIARAGRATTEAIDNTNPTTENIRLTAAKEDAGELTEGVNLSETGFATGERSKTELATHEHG